MRAFSALLLGLAVLLAAAVPASARTRRVVLHVTARNGTVSSPGASGACNGDCRVRIRRGSVVTLAATPAADFRFVRWTGGCVGAAPRCVVQLNGFTTVHATFERIPRTVLLAVGGPGTVVSDPAGLTCGVAQATCSAQFGQGTTVHLDATPAADGVFSSWSDACETAAAATGCDIAVGASAAAATATFAHADPQTDDQTLQVDPGNAHVLSDPPAIDCPPTCGAAFGSGTPVALRGGDWAGACVGFGTCRVIVDAPTQLTASASPPAGGLQYGVSVTVSGPGIVSGSGGIQCGGRNGTLFNCQALFGPGRTVTLRARASRRFRFSGWRGFCSGRRPACTLRVTAAKGVQARFSR